MIRRDVLSTAVAAGACAGLGPMPPARAAATLPARARDDGGFVTARDGTRLFARSWGSGAPVLFLHAWALHSGMWHRQFVDLAARGVRCIAFDRRGHGRSALAGGGYDLDTLADDVARVVEALGLEEITLVGHSMGGAEAVRFCARAGAGAVRRLVLVAPTTPCLTRSPDNPDGIPAELLAAARARMAEDFPRWVEENKAPFVTPETSPQTTDWLARMMADVDLPAVLASARAFAEADVRPDLARIACPTLVIQGDRDASAPLDLTGRRTAQGIAGARLEVYAGAPHGLFVTHAERLSADILAHMA
ncbi:alpha/beta fold hydrolase [Erythrobacter sp. NE805]|uniref:alpha/beta fold hydrolase n=1 Tax=Erythrobacter sp. NE805 TaxID=3389875 RepID=UPI00396B1DDC